MISDPAALTAELQSADTSAHRLVEIAGSFPEYGSLVAEHPNATLDVLSYLLKHGDDVARKAAARRRARDVALITAQQAAPSLIARETDNSQHTVPVRPLRPSEHAADQESRTRPMAPTPQSRPQFQAPPRVEVADDVDQTRLVARSAPKTWRLEIDGQSVVGVPHDEVIIGRKPTAHPDFELAVPLAIPDPTKTLSKSHARLVLRQETWFIVDLGSTNGVLLETAQGERQVAVGAEVPVEAGFVLGDLRMRIIAVEANAG